MASKRSPGKSKERPSKPEAEPVPAPVDPVPVEAKEPASPPVAAPAKPEPRVYRALAPVVTEYPSHDGKLGYLLFKHLPGWSKQRDDMVKAFEVTPEKAAKLGGERAPHYKGDAAAVWRRTSAEGDYLRVKFSGFPEYVTFYLDRRVPLVVEAEAPADAAPAVEQPVPA